MQKRFDRFVRLPTSASQDRSLGNDPVQSGHCFLGLLPSSQRIGKQTQGSSSRRQHFGLPLRAGFVLSQGHQSDWNWLGARLATKTLGAESAADLSAVSPDGEWARKWIHPAASIENCVLV